MKYPWLYVGAKIVCRNAAGSVGRALTVGAVYTVTSVGRRDGFQAGKLLRDVTTVTLAEARHDRHEDGAFCVNRFAPAYPSQQDHIESLKRGMDDAVRRQREHA